MAHLVTYDTSTGKKAITARSYEEDVLAITFVIPVNGDLTTAIHTGHNLRMLVVGDINHSNEPLYTVTHTNLRDMLCQRILRWENSKLRVQRRALRL